MSGPGHEVLRTSPLVEATPTVTELEGWPPGERWALEEYLGAAHDWVAEFNAEELRRWVEVDGKTQTEIAGLVGVQQPAVSKRCKRLGLVSGRTSSGQRRSIPRNTVGPEARASGDDEVVDGAVIGDDPLAPGPSPRRARPEPPAIGKRAANRMQKLAERVTSSLAHSLLVLEDGRYMDELVAGAKFIDPELASERAGELHRMRTRLGPLIKALEAAAGNSR